jgi:hypothetical protein
VQALLFVFMFGVQVSVLLQEWFGGRESVLLKPQFSPESPVRCNDDGFKFLYSLSYVMLLLFIQVILRELSFDLLLSLETLPLQQCTYSTNKQFISYMRVLNSMSKMISKLEFPIVNSKAFRQFGLTYLKYKNGYTLKLEETRPRLLKLSRLSGHVKTIFYLGRGLRLISVKVSLLN